MPLIIVRERLRKDVRHVKRGGAWGEWKTIARLDNVFDAKALLDGNVHPEGHQRVAVHKGEVIMRRGGWK